jgi:hypothetical protein
MFDFTPQLQDVSADPSITPMPSINFPGITPYVGVGLTSAGGAFSALSQYQAGNQSASLLRANASIAGQQAQGEQEAGAEQAELYRQHLNARLGAQAAARGGANVTLSGSALRSLATTNELGAEDIARIQTNAARKAWGFEVTEQGDLARAQMAKSQGTSSAIGSLITTGAKAYGNWASED